ncbi:SIMPL domain-containing protein [Flavobacterium sp.]|uniref:SIMPL domain-containing protein n=1 Tax=Flavobacterium sp. TaxID=239 RepID=UPI00260FA967|nr:SIMPL domain-containing protein [Flavobacterium sp.]
MKNLLFLLLLFLNCSVDAQTNNSNEIVSDGHAVIKIAPDIAILTITVDKDNDSELTAIKDLNTEMQRLQQSLATIGFKKEHIKIAEYTISKDRYNGDEQKKYRATNVLRIVFPLDNRLIDAFYQQVQLANHKDTDVAFDTQLSSELENTIRLKLVAAAIADAKTNADNIAKALNVAIHGVKKVSKYNDRVFEDRSYKKSGLVAAACLVERSPNPKTAFDQLDVEEKELVEDITITFEIVKV